MPCRCLDYPAQNNVAVMKEQGKALTDAAPYLGPYFAYSDLSCLSWPFQSENVSGPDRGARGSARSSCSARRTTRRRRTSGRWMSRRSSRAASSSPAQGDGHTAFNKGNACVDAAVEQYLIDGVVPPRRRRCAEPTGIVRR